MEWFLYAIVGGIAGFFAGLLGIGGGTVVGPLLILIFTSLLSISPDYAVHLAIGTSLGVIVLTSTSSAITHIRNGNIIWPLAVSFSVILAVFAFIGVQIAFLFSPTVLALMLVALLAINIFFMLFSKNTTADRCPVVRPLPKAGAVAVVGFTGMLSAMLGIGGGIIIVPYLHRYGISMKYAIGTAASTGMPLSVAAAVGYILHEQPPELAERAWGFLYLPAFVGVGFFSIITAIIGAQLSNRLPADTLRKIFAALMFAVMLRLVWQFVVA